VKVVILAGGYGTRISEETDMRPKPMVEIGDRPILGHIMKSYAQHGFTEFVILLGYKGYMIKEYFANYYLHNCDVTVDTSKNSLEMHNNANESWKVTLVDTGLDTMTGGRVKRAEKYIGRERFMLTYGDGLTDANFKDLLKFHEKQKAIVTLTAIQPEGRFGALDIDASGQIHSFLEKPKGDGSWVNGGFFVCEPQIFDYLKDGDKTILERAPLEMIAKENKLAAFKHAGFWQCMDTLRDKTQLCEMWDKKKAPWKVWP
jgi:glucose-1-phosphate cytidylyltransferase